MQIEFEAQQARLRKRENELRCLEGRMQQEHLQLSPSNNRLVRNKSVEIRNEFGYKLKLDNYDESVPL